VYRGSTPLVSTELICSTMEKKPLSWASIAACSAGCNSSRARWAMRVTSSGINAMGLRLYWTLATGRNPGGIGYYLRLIHNPPIVGEQADDDFMDGSKVGAS